MTGRGTSFDCGGLVTEFESGGSGGELGGLEVVGCPAPLL